MAKKRKAVRRRKSTRALSHKAKPVKRRKQPPLEAVSAADSCLSLIQSVQIVAKALSPKTFHPPEKLGDTYLTSQERELFKARVVRGVTGAGCQIGDTDVPAEEGTTHSAVVGAIRENAHD